MSAEEIGQPQAAMPERGLSFLRGIATSRSTLALLDQAVVSGTSFLTTVIVGRFCGSRELGYFALATSILVVVGGTQTSLVNTPYTVFRSRLSGHAAHRTRAGSTLIGAASLGSVVLAVAVCAALLTSVVSPERSVALLAWTLAGVIPFFLAREFCRRFEFARRNVRTALMVDSLVAALQITFLAFGVAFNCLSAILALMAIGAACLLVFSVWLAWSRHEFHFSRGEILPTMRRDWDFGRWLLADHLLCVTQIYAMHWMLTFLVSPAAAGVFTACGAVSALASPFLQGTGNYLAPKIAETVSAGLKRQTLQIYWGTTLILGVFVLAFTVVVTVFGNDLMWLLYRDRDYDGTGIIVGTLALRLVLAIPTIAADHTVIAMERSREAVLATLTGLVATFALAIPFIHWWGVVGAAFALVLGTLCETITMLAVFIREMRNWHWKENAKD